MVKNNLTMKIAYSGITASLYFVLSLAVLPLSSGAVQFRVSEGLTILPLFFPESIIGLTIGCLITNIISSCAIFDVIFGSLITCISAVLTYLIGKTNLGERLKFVIGGGVPVLLNSFLLPLVWYFAYGLIEYFYFLQVLFLLIGESISVYVVGLIIYKGIKKFKDEGGSL